MINLPLRCKNAARYQGLRKPKCNGGRGCIACILLYRQQEMKRRGHKQDVTAYEMVFGKRSGKDPSLCDAPRCRQVRLSMKSTCFKHTPGAVEPAKPPRQLKTRIHFNRINMQRGDSRVWSAHNSHSCNMSEKIVVMHNGVKVLETVYNPNGRQPRAYLEAKGTVRHEYGMTIVEV